MGIVGLDQSGDTFQNSGNSFFVGRSFFKSIGVVMPIRFAPEIKYGIDSISAAGPLYLAAEFTFSTSDLFFKYVL